MSLAVAYPALWPSYGDLGKARAEIADAYSDYTATVSRADMAISLETAAYILWLARHVEARTAIDFGSGFTSAVLRYARCATTSIDDSPEWLARTGEYLDRLEMDRAGLVLWPDFLPEVADLVVYDFAGGERRNWNYGLAFDCIGKVGVMDDAHHRGHAAYMHRAAFERHYDIFGLAEFTTDCYGRYAALVVRP
jgi:hypothetical protein